ncbi:MAG: GNAT family N-acetyltransferase [Chitinophagaceae bacterium]|nr:GNAT family N-acetyltransferase [Chitinophagaceae bacterium]
MNIILRNWTEQDAPRLASLANDPDIAANMTDLFPSPYLEEHARGFIQMANSHDPANIRCIEFEGEAVGGIGIHPQQDIYRKNAELGYWLGKDYWGKGIITEAIRLMLPYAFQHWDIERIYARPYGRNLGSQKVLEKNGFTLEARLPQTIFKLGQFEDELIYAFRRDRL